MRYELYFDEDSLLFATFFHCETIIHITDSNYLRNT